MSVAVDTAVGTVLEVPVTVAIKSAAAMLVCVSKDEVTAVLTAAYFDGSELFATDRYRIARFPMPHVPSTDDGARLVLGDPFLIPQGALAWVSKLTLRSLEYGAGPALTVPDRGYTVRYERNADAHTVSASVVDMFGTVERVETFEEATGNYPPVQRLFENLPDADGDTQEYDPKLMGAILAYCAKHGGKGAPFSLRLVGASYPKGSPSMVIVGADATFLLTGHHRR